MRPPGCHLRPLEEGEDVRTRTEPPGRPTAEGRAGRGPEDRRPGECVLEACVFLKGERDGLCPKQPTGETVESSQRRFHWGGGTLQGNGFGSRTNGRKINVNTQLDEPKGLSGSSLGAIFTGRSRKKP